MSSAHISDDDAAVLVRMRAFAKKMGWSKKQLFRYAEEVLKAAHSESEVDEAKRVISALDPLHEPPMRRR